MVRFAAGEIKSSLEGKGYLVMLVDMGNLENVRAPHRIVLTAKDSWETDRFLNKGGMSSLPGLQPQGYSVRTQNYVGYKEWYVIGADAKGTMYGAIDISETIKLKGLDDIAEVDKTPYIARRGIKFNVPLDARTPSYSDNSDAARQNILNVWDINFWHEFLDEMARDHFNLLSLWSLSPFPGMVDVPEYPAAGLQDVKKTTAKIMATTDAWFMSTPATLAKLQTIKKLTLAQKISFWNQVMQYAGDRGIDCYLFTWNLFAFGTETSGYGFTDKISDDKTKDYIRKATKALIKEYPLLKGIGVTAGENMYRSPEAVKEKFLYESYGMGINDALAEDNNRKFTLVHRAHQADIDVIKNAFAGLHSNCTLDFSYKYSVAQMYSAVAPQYIYESKFLDHIGDSKFYLTVRDDAWYYLRGGSDPAFARAYFKAMPKKNLEGFYLGPDGYTWGREYLSKTPATPNQLVIKKRWYSFRINGRLAYDPELPDSYFISLLANRYPQVNSKALFEAWAAASKIMPLVNRFHNERAQNDFQWYPEACTSFYGFRTIDNFINSAPQKGEGLAGIPEYTKAVLNGTSVIGTSPFEVAGEFKKVSDRAVSLVAGMSDIKSKELLETINDIKAMAYLGLYYSHKIRAATNKDIFDKSADAAQKTKCKNEALRSLRDASVAWQKYAAQMDRSYVPQYLTRMHFAIDFKAMQANVDKEITILNSAPTDFSFDTKPPVQQLEVAFSNASKNYYWHLDKMGLPSDWSAAKEVVLEVYATSRQPFNFFLETSTDSLVKKNIQPEIGWNRIVIPLDAFKQGVGNGNSVSAAASNRQPALNEVLLVGVSIDKPDGYPVLEIRSIKLKQANQNSTATPASIVN